MSAKQVLAALVLCLWFTIALETVSNQNHTVRGLHVIAAPLLSMLLALVVVVS